MDPEIEQLLVTRYSELPLKIKDLLFRPFVSSSIRIVGQKHNLPEDKILILDNEVLLVLLAFETIDSFEETIVKELLVPGSVAHSIAEDIKSMLFHEVEGELRGIYAERDAYEKAHTEESSASSLSATPSVPTAPVVQARPFGLPPLSPVPDPIRPASASPTPTLTPVASDVPRYQSDPYREPPTA